MNSDDVMRALVRGMNLRTSLLVPNVSWGLIYWGECDLLKMSGAGYLTEYEIKVSVSDFRREWKKKRWNNPIHRKAFERRIKNYWIVAPKKIAAKIIPEMPDGIGLMAVNESSITRREFVEVIIPTKSNPARPLTEKEKFQLARLGTLRFWSRFMK